jgi:hypothetical protein
MLRVEVIKTNTLVTATIARAVYGDSWQQFTSRAARWQQFTSRAARWQQFSVMAAVQRDGRGYASGKSKRLVHTENARCGLLVALQAWMTEA